MAHFLTISGFTDSDDLARDYNGYLSKRWMWPLHTYIVCCSRWWETEKIFWRKFCKCKLMFDDFHYTLVTFIKWLISLKPTECRSKLKTGNKIECIFYTHISMAHSCFHYEYYSKNISNSVFLETD